MPSNTAKIKQLSWMQAACLLCDNSTLDIKTGCLAVQNDLVVSQGWNHNTIDTVIHAEQAMIEDANRANRSLTGCDVYTTRFPCPDCAELLLKTGITNLYYMSDHFSSNNSAIKFLTENGINVSQLQESEVWSK